MRVSKKAILLYSKNMVEREITLDGIEYLILNSEDILGVMK